MAGILLVADEGHADAMLALFCGGFRHVRCINHGDTGMMKLDADWRQSRQYSCKALETLD